MIPFPMLPTASGAERQLYEGFLAQLSDDYVVYHSVEWVLASPTPGAPPIEGECDFLIAHPDDGLLVREAKGGQVRYDPSTRRWMQTGHSGTHVLDEDPFHQAQDEMRSLVEILSAQPGWDRWRPSYGTVWPSPMTASTATHTVAPSPLGPSTTTTSIGSQNASAR